MLRKFSIDTNPYLHNECLYQNSEIILYEGVNCLVGCNGSGKSTVIKLIEDLLTERKEPFFDSDDAKDVSLLQYKLTESNRMSEVASLFMSSEGEKVAASFEEWVADLGKFVRNNTSSSELFVFLDGVELGLSIDAILNIKNFLAFLIDDCRKRGKSLYIVLATNAYEFTRDVRCIDVYDFSEVTFSSYEDFRSFVMTSAQHKKNKHN